MGIISKRKTTGSGPITTQLQDGELAVNLVENRLSIGKKDGIDGNFEIITKEYTDNVDMTNVMSKVQFETNAAMNREKFAGSGFVEWGKNNLETGNLIGIGTNVVLPNYLRLGRNDTANGFSTPKININGTYLEINGLSNPTTNDIYVPENKLLPAITDSTQTPEMKQGDMSVLTDLDRAMITAAGLDGTLESYSVDGDGTTHSELKHTVVDGVMEFSSSGNGYFQYALFVAEDLIPGVKYKVSVNVVDNVDNIGWGYHDSSRYLPSFDYNDKHATSGVVTCEFTAVTNILRLYFSIPIGNDTSVVRMNDFSINQSEEASIVAMTDTTAGDIYSKTSLYKVRDSISRQDIAFLETWREDIADKDIVYPYGNVQFLASDVDGLTGLAEGGFEGADTYSLFGLWQDAGELIGRGYVWSKLSLADKVALASNPDNNIFRDGEKWIQVRHRIRVIKGLGNDWNYDSVRGDLNFDHNTVGQVFGQGPDVKAVPIQDYRPIGTSRYYRSMEYSDHNSSDSLASIGVFGAGLKNTDLNMFAIPLALVQKRNAGIWHESFNPEGCARLYLDGAAVMSYLAPEGTITSLADCFNHDLIATIDITDATNASRLSSLDDGTDNGDTYKVTGTIASAMSGRPDGIYEDEINERDVEDLRMSAHTRNYDELREEYLRKAIAGEIRGKNGTPFLKAGVNPNDLLGVRWCNDDGSLNEFLEVRN